MSDFYENMIDLVYGPVPVTVEDKIEYALVYYSGDSGVSEGELEAYLRDLVATVRAEGA